MKSDKGDNDSTRKKILKTGLELFSKYGYDATSTRMIAKEADVSLSSISFHFENKENLFVECLKFIANKISALYEDIYDEINILLNKDSQIKKEETYACLKKLIHRQITVTFGYQYQSSLKLVYWEQINSAHHFISETIFERIEKAMALLVSKTVDISYEKALIASRFINGSIIAFGEHYLLVNYALGSDEKEKEIQPWVRDEISHCCDVLFKGLLGISTTE